MNAYTQTLRLGIVCLLIIFSTASLHATHFLGGDIFYECIGGGVYRIYHKSYYDCAGLATIPLPGPPSSTVNFQITGAAGCVAPTPMAPWQFQSYVEVTPLCPGVSSICTDPNSPLQGTLEGVFYRDYNFNSTTCLEYELSWETCCRTNAITSLILPGNQGIRLTATLDISASPCNSSPQFLLPPVINIMAGTPSIFSQAAFDPDGDSLVYALVECYTDANIPVVYDTASGYNSIDPMGPSWEVQIDSLSGILTFQPDPTGSIVHGVMCIEVKEFRNGVEIGRIVRDIGVYSTPALGNQAPVFDSITGISGGQQLDTFVVQACTGPVSYTVHFSDPDALDTLQLFTNIGSVLPGASISSTGTNPLQAQVDWTPAPTDTGTYSFFLAVSDQACLISAGAIDTFTLTTQGLCIDGAITSTTCLDSTGAISLTIDGGTAPYTILWSTGDTTMSIDSLLVGTYTVQVTDAMGSTATQTFLIEPADFTLTIQEVLPSCAGMDGQLTATFTGGIAPYTYLWNTGDTTAVIDSLSPGGYSILITDSVGCVAQETIMLPEPDSCFVLISGRVYDDFNNNCIQDPGEPGRPWIYIDLQPGGAAFSDANGDYQFQVDTGAYTVSQYLGLYTYLTPNCLPAGLYSFNFTSYADDTLGIDFANDSVAVQDLQVYIYGPSNNAPGQNSFYNISYYNPGTVPVTANIEWTHNPLLQYISASVAPTIYDPLTQTGNWNLGTLNSGGNGSFSIQMEIDSTATLGQVAESYVTIYPVMGDTVPANNSDTTFLTIATSWDPNDKQVSPAGIGSAGYIEQEQGQLRYTVRFQNTGNYPAFHVVIRDTLNVNLMANSFRPAGSSHPYTLDLTEEGTLVFDFANILLPDSASDPIGSQGFVSFIMDYDSTSPPATVIENRAAIYFDFNAPILTNIARNTLYIPLKIGIQATDSLLLCVGDTIQGTHGQTGAGMVELMWNTGDSGTFTEANSSGWYTLVGIDEVGAHAADSIYVSVIADPEGYFSYENDAWEVSFTDSLVSGNIIGWDFGDGQTGNGTSPAHTYGASDSFQVSLFLQNECGVRDTFTHWVDLTGVVSLEKDLVGQVKISPNPFTHRTLISFPNGGAQPFTIKLLDINGRVVRTYSDIRTSEIEISRETLSAGIYVVELAGPFRYYGKVWVE